MEATAQSAHFCADSPAASTCIIPGCTDPIHARGLCVRDYICATRMIDRGQTSWAELEAYRIVRPARQARKRAATIRGLLVASRASGRCAPMIAAEAIASLYDRNWLPGH